MILALRALGLGDLLTSVPALRALRRRFPRQEIALAAPEALDPLIQRIDAVDRLIPVASAVDEPPGRLPPVEPAPIVAVNLHGRGPQSTAALRHLRPANLWSYGVPGAPQWRDHEHEVRRWCRLVEAYGCVADPADLRLGGAPSGTGPVLIHPGAAHPARRWPAGRFAAVARRLTSRGCAALVTAGPGEEHLAERVAGLAALPAGSVISGVDLGQLADLIHRSCLVVCGDTGVAHLATAYGTPSVVLFGPQSPARWGPPPGGRHRVLWRPSPRVDRAQSDGPHPSLLRIQPADVLAAAEEVGIAVHEKP